MTSSQNGSRVDDSSGIAVDFEGVTESTANNSARTKPGIEREYMMEDDEWVSHSEEF